MWGPKFVKPRSAEPTEHFQIAAGLVSLATNDVNMSHYDD